MAKAIFLDRDGVINELVFHPKTKEYVAPHFPDELKLFPWTIDAIKTFQQLGYKLFIVSNQPDCAKGKTTLENLNLVHEKLHKIFIENNIVISEYFYCYHHPNGINPELTQKCECRKPGIYFLKLAKKKFNIDFKKSWFIGDRDTDIYCGQNAGTKTIQIKEEKSLEYTGKSSPDFIANNLKEACEIIKKEGL
ncbi:MAG: HAD family hydrolase [Candidatus Melainabacteria bacterium]|nr:HAD family hydrolase [Candidatus Melainabacteria bacterium]